MEVRPADAWALEAWDSRYVVVVLLFGARFDLVVGTRIIFVVF